MSTEASTPQDFAHLLSPLTVGPLTIRNRMLVSGHQPSMAKNGLPTEQYLAYQRARARGGVGLQITGATGVHPTGMYGADHGALVNIDDRIIPGYQALAEVVHAEGGRILAQLAHAGSVIQANGAGLPLWAPSAVAADLVREVPHEMTLAEIEEVIEAFGAAASRARQGGMDGVEILGAFGLLITAFMSPYANTRTDAYGGSLEKRMRFPLEVVAAVRENAGSDLIVGMRIPGDELVKGGLNLPQMQEIAKILAASGQVDYLNVIAGTNMERFQRVGHWPPTPAKHGLFVHLASGIKEVVELPVFTVGRIVDPRHAEQILAEGHADMVGMTRAHIADPEIITKVQEGRLADIRPCVGANVCISRAMAGQATTCIHNPETSREAVWGSLKPTAQAKHVVVIGGGPAGLEVARVAALRGHRVELYERAATLGGQLRLWAQTPAVGEFQKIIDWQEQQLQKLDVTVHLNTPLTTDKLQKLAAEVVVVATGSKPQDISIPGADQATIQIASPHEMAAGQINAVKRAVIWNKGGGQAGLSAAETLLKAGTAVEIVTPDFAVGEDIQLIIRVPQYKRLLSAGAIFTPNTEVIRLAGGDVVGQNIYSLQEHRISGVDLLIPWLGNQVVESLSPVIQARGLELYTIGDCVAPRTVDVAMAEGAQVGRDI